MTRTQALRMVVILMWLLPGAASAQSLGSSNVTTSATPDPGEADFKWVQNCPPMTRGDVSDVLERATHRMLARGGATITDVDIIDRIAECLRSEATRNAQ